MSKQLRFALLLLLVLSLPLTIAAQVPDTAPAVTPQDGDGDELTEVFEATSGATVMFPEGWVAEENPDDGSIEIFNDPALLERDDDQDPQPGEAGVIIFPGIPAGGMEVSEVLSLVTAQNDDPAMIISDIEEIDLDGTDAFRVDIADDVTDGIFIAYEGPNDTIVLTAGMTATGEMEDFEDTLLAIIASVELADAGDMDADGGDDDDMDADGDDGDMGDDDDMAADGMASYTTAGGLTFEYPEDWFLEEDATGLVLLANSEEAAIAPVLPEDGLGIIVLGPDIMSLLVTSPAPADALDETLPILAGDDPDIEFSETEITTVNGNEAARASFTTPDSEGFALVFDFGDGQLGMIMAIGGPEGFEMYEDAALAVAESMSFE
jgi:hypothetical protein